MTVTNQIRGQRVSNSAAVIVLATASLLTACGTSEKDAPSSSVSGSKGGGGAIAGSGPGAGPGGGDDGRLCERTLPPMLETGAGNCTQVGTVFGQVLDEDGNPPTSKTITVCANVCMYGELEADGRFSMTVDTCYEGSGFYGVPVMIYHGWPDYADVTVNFVPDGVNDLPSADVGVIRTVSATAMTKYSYPEALSTTFTDGNGFEIEVGECALELPAFDEDVYVGALDVVDFPLPDAPTDSLGLYFVGPDNAYFTTPGTVRFPNTTQLAPGTAVELMALGNMGTTTVIGAGIWGPVGTGRVSADGAYVQSDPAEDSGLITLGWIGYRLAQ